jgi:glycerol-3-phosphate dehydrogenase
MYDVAIIGAGIAGTFIGRELSKYNLKVVMIDKENDVANATTMANSAIIHAGYDAKAGKNKGKFNAKGNLMFDPICEDLDVPFTRCGSLVIGFDETDKKTIQDLYDNGVKNGVPDMKVLSKEETLEKEPNLSEEVVGALWAPTAGIISPWELAIALAENAMENGAELKLSTEVTDIEKLDDKYKVITNNGEIEAKYVINCAGVYADKIYGMVGKPEFEIKPRKGHYFVLDKDAGELMNSVIFQCPSEKGKGVLVTPTVHGNLLVGPDSEFVDDKGDLGTTSDRLSFIREAAALTTKKVEYSKVIRSFVGLRATSSTGDFIIEEAKDAKGFVNVAGYESPGLSSIPAVAEYVVEIMQGITGGLEEKADFNPKRRKYIRFEELSDTEKAEIIKKDPRYGRIICRCEGITEGEIIDSIHRKAGATTVKGVKKRTRSGMGRCQGGFCSPRVVEILSRELGEKMEDIVLDSKKSFILTGKTKNDN